MKSFQMKNLYYNYYFMRKIVGALLLVFVLFLSGCFGSDTEEKTPVIQTEE